jgi:hypothetical protein
MRLLQRKLKVRKDRIIGNAEPPHRVRLSHLLRARASLYFSDISIRRFRTDPSLASPNSTGWRAISVRLSSSLKQRASTQNY